MPDPSGEKSLSNSGKDGQKPGIDAATENALRNEFLLKQQFHTHERSNPSILDLGLEAGHSALYSGVQGPVIGLAQLADKGLKTNLAEKLEILPAPEEAKFGTARWHVQVIGGAAGMTLPFIATRGGLKASGLTFAARTESTMLASSRLLSARNAAVVADGAMAGFAYDFLMTPVQKGESDFWTARRNHGLTGAATFGTLTAGSVALRAVARPIAGELVGAKRLAFDVTGGIVSGAPAGVANADVSARLSKGRWATGEERVQGAYTMAMAGGVLSAFHKIPGQDISPGEKALKARAQNSGVANLESMLAERARQAKTTVAADATVSNPTAMPEASLLGGAKKGAGSEASRMTSDKTKTGRAMASTEGVEIKADVKPEQQALLQKGVDMAFQASDPAAPATDMVTFLKYARGEGAGVMEALLKVAEQSGDKGLLTVVREAYLPLEGIEHRVIEGEAKINPEPGKPVTQDQITRWKQFTDLISAEPPAAPEGYSKFRTDLFQWLDKNPDLHSWVQQLAKQNSWSNLAGPLDFYFQTNEMARFMQGVKPRVDKPITIADVQKMRTYAEEFVDQALVTPYEGHLVENFRALSEKSAGLNVPQLARLINEALAKKGLDTLCHVGVDSNWQMTLHMPKSSKTSMNISKVDYSSVQAPEKAKTPDIEETSRIANEFGRALIRAEDAQQAQFIFADTALHLKNEGVPLADVPSELNHVMKYNKMPYEVVVGTDGQLELNHITKSEGLAPIASVFFDPDGKVHFKTATEAGADWKTAPYKTDGLGRESLGKVDYDKAQASEAGKRAAETQRLSLDFARLLDKAENPNHAHQIFTDTLVSMRDLGVPAPEVPGELNKVLKRYKMPYEVVVTDGALELVFVEGQ